MLEMAQQVEFAAGIRRDVSRAILLEVQEVFPVGARQADHSINFAESREERPLVLSSRRKRLAIGLLRAQMLDEAFEQILTRNGVEFVRQIRIDVGTDEKKETPVFVTVGRFGSTLLGFASHLKADDLPNKRSKSRRALCTLNSGLTRDLFNHPESYRDADRFAILMVRRDLEDVSKIAMITVCLIDAKQERFVYQQELSEFLAGYGSASGVRPRRTTVLKPVKTTFKGSPTGEQETR
ncbi:hypothetical protein [Agrobacterium rosae]|uniref:hypothetical protein n=1 Tax=Agrobacterium rosae TaxID=1972867 RepID=UPI003BA3D11F